MEAILWLALGFGLMIAFGSLSTHREAAHYKENSPPDLPQLDELSRTGLEEIWVENKRRIFKNTRTPSKNSNSYELKLLSQNRQLENRLLRTHKELFTTNEIAELTRAKCSRTVGSNVFSLRQDIDLNKLSDSDIASLIFFSYSETPINSDEFIKNDPLAIIKFTDHLLKKNYVPALLLKGIILKYGFYPVQRPFSRQAKQHLESAFIAGLTQADIELKNIHIHFELDETEDGYGDAVRVLWK